MAVGIGNTNFIQADPVAAMQQGAQAGQQLQQNALSLQAQQQQASDQSALRNALSQGINGTPQAQQNALATLTQAAPTQVGAYQQQVGSVTAQNAAQLQAKSQQVMSQLSSLVAIPSGPQREQAYQQMLAQERQQGFDVSAMQGLPADQGIKMAYLRAQDVQSQLKALAPQSFDLAAGASRMQVDPISGQTTTLAAAPTQGKYVDNFNTGQTDAQGNPILAQGYVTPQGFQPIGRATSQGGQPQAGMQGDGQPQAGGQGVRVPVDQLTAQATAMANQGGPGANSQAAEQWLMQQMQANGYTTSAAPGGNAAPAAPAAPAGMPQQAPNAAAGGDPGGTGTSVGMGGGAAPQMPMPDPSAPIQPVTGISGQGTPAQSPALPFGTYVQHEAAAKLPTGYRLKPGGNGALEPIPGGPADKSSSGASLGDPTMTGPAFLATIQDPGIRQQIQAIAEGRMPLPNISRPSKSGEIGPQQLAAAVAQYDPTYNQQDPQSRIKARNDFTSGKSAMQLRQLNTLLGHLGGVSDAADALKNGSLPIVNQLENAVSSGVGHPLVSNFNAAAAPAAEEFAALMKGGSPAVADIEAAKSALNPNMSPDQLRGTIGTMAAQVQSRIAALQAQANQGLGPYASKVQIITQDGQQALNKLRQKGLIPAFNQGEGANTQAPPGQNPNGLPVPQSAAEYAALPVGAHYQAPDGSVRQKGGG